MNKFKFTAYMFLYLRTVPFAKFREVYTRERRDVWQIILLAGIVWAAFSFSGCAKEDQQMYLEAKEQEPAADPEMGDADAGSEPKKEANQDTCFVYVCGAVRKPGVYELPAGSRIYEAIKLAGGLKKNASVKGINQAQPLSDGDMVEILTVREKKELEQDDKDGPAGNGPEASGDAAGGRVNINTASAAELMTLNGIGEAKAANIIAYRESNGNFASTEELMNVSGIGEGVYANIQDKITVVQ